MHLIDGRFRVKIPGDAGFATAAGEAVAHRAPKPDLGENVEMARLSNLLFRATGNADYRTLAERAMRYLATPEVATSGPPAGVLVAALELGREPAHVTVVGAKNDPAARSLFLAALTVPTSYKRTEWWDRSEGPLPNSDVAYPELGRVAAFACSEGRCSLPAFSPRDLRDRIERITKRPQ
jgi:hypothetical protein